MTDTVEFEILEWSEQVDKIAPALVAAQRGFAPITKTEEGKVDTERAKYSYKYADLAGVLAATVPSLNANGIFFSQPSAIAGFKATCVTLLLHESGQWVRSRLTITSKGDDPQKLGGALTYARRYAANGILGVSPNEDDDGKGASTRDDRDDIITDLQTDIATAQADRAKFQLGLSKTATRLIARSVPFEWQVATARELSGGSTAVWTDLDIAAMVAFYNRIGDEFPDPNLPKEAEKPPQAHDEFTQALAVAVAPETPADGDSTPKAPHSEAERLDFVAWIEPRLAQSDLSVEEIQDLAAGVRRDTLNAQPDLDVSITYDWRELDMDELRSFWTIVPKKARTTAGATA